MREEMVLTRRQQSYGPQQHRRPPQTMPPPLQTPPLPMQPHATEEVKKEQAEDSLSSLPPL